MIDTPAAPPTRRFGFLRYFSIGLVVAPLVGLGWILVARSDAASSTFNDSCPVIYANAALPDFQVTYKNKQIRFCCNECITEFLTYPEVYENQVPQLQDQTLRERVQALFDANVRFAACGALALMLAGLLLYRLSTKGRPASVGWMSRLITRRVPLAYPLLILVGVLGWEVYSLRGELTAKHLEDDIHFATMYDFGTPPVPPRPPVKPRVKATFYRGNDERSPRLFNNGNYRTATFLVSIQDGQGRELDHGVAPGSQDLFLRLEIVRPKFTPDFLFSDKIMNKMFLTQEFDKFLGRDEPVADAVPFTAVEEMQRWQALFPVGRVAAEGNDHKRGLIYVCEKCKYQSHWWSTEEAWGGSRYHYGIGYDLRIKDGKLSADSDLWMGSLYRTRKVAEWKVPRAQWFSHEEIPLLPKENIQDPKLLGIEDYAERD